MKPSDLLKKTLQYYWRTTRALTLGAQACVLTEDNQVLLIKHTYRPGWHFPGGGVEKNETLRAALERELMEEANIELTAGPELFALYSNFAFFPGDHIAVFTVRHWRQTKPPKPSHEIAAHGFFPIGDLPEGISPPTLTRINEITNGTKPLEAW